MGNSLSVSNYIVPFLIAAGVAIALGFIVRRFALRHEVVDRPETSPDRKVQMRPVPLLGGVAIFVSVLLVGAGYTFFSDRILGGYMQPKYLIGIAVAGLLIMIGGYLDDRFSLSPKKQIVWPLLATVVIIGSGIGVSYITNPFGGVIDLESIRWQLFSLGETPFYFVLLADLFAFVWLMGMMYTTKFLDGLDGLVSGITTIGALVLFFLSLNQDVAQPETALLAVIFAGACAGFLVLNFHPAKMYLGESGSLFTGFMLGTLAIISGAKIATAVLIMGIPILDVIWVIVRRIFFEKKSAFMTADKKHLHFRLLDVGLSHRQAVLFLYGLTLVFGGVALFLGGREKIIALIIMLLVMFGLGTWLVVQYRRRNPQQTD